MKEKLEALIMHHITQRSTWVALGAGLLAVVSEFKPEWVSVLSAILAAFGLLITDKRRFK